MKFLYRYVFRGIGIVILIGVLTGLYVLVSNHQSPLQQHATGTHR